MNKSFVLVGLIVLVTGCLMMVGSSVSSIIKEDHVGKDVECVVSEYNTFSNSTEGYYLFGYCYIPVMDSYETREVCRGGFLGIGLSCYESDTPRTEYIRKEVCFELKTGERC